MTFIELFAGIGGFRLGIGSKAKCVYANEWDKYAAQIYEKNFKEKPNTRSITDVRADEIPDHDLLVGGFPCQAFSIAGKRGGFEDTRGTLFFEIARIAKAKRPKLLFLENVKGLLSHNKRQTFGTILSTLSDLGYVCEWQVLNSKDFGVPQNRERVFIIGHLRGQSRQQVFPIGEDGQFLDGQKRKVSRGISVDTKKRDISNNKSKLLQDGENRLLSTDRLTPPQNGAMLIKEATKKGYDTAQEGDSINLSVPNSKTRRGRVGKSIAQTVDTGMQQHTLQNAKIRRLTPIECERLQGFPDNWTEGVSDTQRYKMLGNAVTVNVIEAIAERLLDVL